MYVENEYCAKHRHVLVIIPETVLCNTLLSSAMASRFGQSSYDSYDWSSDDEEYSMPGTMAEMMPGRSDCTACLLTAPRLYLDSPPELPQNWGQINPDLNDYYSNPMEISSTFSIPHISDWWRQHEEKHFKYADLSNVARDVFSIRPHGVGMEANFSIWWDVIGWWQSKTTGETIRHRVVVRQFPRANNQIVAVDDRALDTTNTEHNLELKTKAEERTLHRMAKNHYFLETQQGCQNIHATQKDFHDQTKQMTAIGYISDTEEIVKMSWSNFQHDGATAFQLSDRSPVPPALSAKNLPGGRTQLFNVCHITRIDRHPVESDEDGACEIISDTRNWPDWNRDSDNRNHREDNWEAANESDKVLDNGI